MNGANIGTFDLNSPADTEALSLADDRMRSIKSTMQQVLDDEHNFPSAGGASVGYHKLGSARPYFGPQSNVSSSGTDGRTMIASDTSRLFGVGSAGTVMLGGGPTSIALAPGYLTYPQRSAFVEECGYAVTTASTGTVLITIPNSGYSGVPFVTLTSMYTNYTGTDADAVFSLSVRTIDGASFIVRSASGGAIVGGAAFLWRSLGTRTL